MGPAITSRLDQNSALRVSDALSRSAADVATAVLSPKSFRRGDHNSRVSAVRINGRHRSHVPGCVPDYLRFSVMNSRQVPRPRYRSRQRRSAANRPEYLLLASYQARLLRIQQHALASFPHPPRTPPPSRRYAIIPYCPPLPASPPLPSRPTRSAASGPPGPAGPLTAWIPLSMPWS